MVRHAMIPRTPKVLIVKLSAIGDVVHTLPVLNALRHYRPEAQITWLVEETAADLVVGHAALDRVLISRRKRWIRGLRTAQWRDYLREAVSFIRQLRDTRYDMVLDFQAALKGAMLIALTRADRKIGFGSGMEHQEHSYLALNERIPMVSMEIHALQRGLMLLSAIGVPCHRIEYNLPIDDPSRQIAAGLLVELPHSTKRPLVAINPMATWETKLWPADRFAEVADRLIQSRHAAIYFTGSPGDRDAIRAIQDRMTHPSVNLAGRTTLIQLAAFYQHMACVISADTGPMHIAAAVNKPVVALFGPTAPWRTGPYGQDHHVIRPETDCGPCFRRQCADWRCMDQIQPDRVVKVCASILDHVKNGTGNRE